jgi:hypothetical protein
MLSGLSLVHFFQGRQIGAAWNAPNYTRKPELVPCRGRQINLF